MNIEYLETEMGDIEICAEDGFVTRVYFVDSRKSENPSPTTSVAKKQLSEYFNKMRKEFEFSMRFDGTDFQKKVWNATCNIPFGKIVSYSDIANIIGKPNATRAVGTALGKNKILIAMPCHRIITKAGTLGGFAGGLDRKATLLGIEGNII